MTQVPQPLLTLLRSQCDAPEVAAVPAITDSKLGDTAGLSSAEVDAAAVRGARASGGGGGCALVRSALTRRLSTAAQGASGAALWQVAFMPGADTRSLAALEWGARPSHARTRVVSRC